MQSVAIRRQRAGVMPLIKHAIKAAASTLRPCEKLVPVKTRITLTALLSLTPLACALAAPPPAKPPGMVRRFTFAAVEHLAALRAEHGYHTRSTPLPGILRRLSYAQYHQIRFRPADALWRGHSMFQVEFYHRGFAFTRRVNIYTVSASAVRELPYRPSLFEFPAALAHARLPANLGFAGFSLRYPLDSPAHHRAVLAFLGASYFRVLGRNQEEGVTARGLAIDTATTGGEEIPYFTDYWLVKPAPEATTMTVYALLDSPSLTGAYRFLVRPGAITQVTVSAVLYPRRRIAKLGIAPLTSMFLYGMNSARRRFDNWHPQLHDSDGLMMHTGSGEWLWRPLRNPLRLQVNRFMDDNPRGFGLIQRDRRFADYEDPVARYESRPSYWVEPLGRWGKGGVELVEIPSEADIDYNIDAYWVPSAPVRAGQPLAFSYLLSAYLHSGKRWPPGGRVAATRFAPVVRDGHSVGGLRRTIIDFTGGDLDGLRASQPVRAVVTALGARISDVDTQRLPENGHWRVSFTVRPTSGRPIDMHCYLELYGAALTETWTYQWTPRS